MSITKLIEQLDSRYLLGVIYFHFCVFVSAVIGLWLIIVVGVSMATYINYASRSGLSTVSDTCCPICAHFKTVLLSAVIQRQRLDPSA